MKKNIFLTIATFVVLVACKSRDNKRTNGTTSAFLTYYNTLFNGEEAMKSELETRKQNFQEDFYADYIPILKYSESPLGADEASSFFANDLPVGSIGGGKKQAPSKSVSVLQISENKAMKAIAKYSIMKNGEEKNKKIFDAHIILAQSRLYQNRPLEAIDALGYLFTNMRNDKRIDLAKIYQAQAFAEMKDFYRAETLFRELSEKKIKKSYGKLLSIYYSQLLLKANKKEEAITELENAFNLNKNRELRSRIAFQRGQILAKIGKKDEARESFSTAYKYANDFEFEVKSQIEIAKTFDAKNDDYQLAIKHLEDISKKGTYASRKNELYYAMGIIANNAAKTDEALAYFEKAKTEKTSDSQIRGLTYYEIGKHFFNQKDYIAAGVYYDSALASMSKEESRLELQNITKNIKKVANNYYIIKKNDSILSLTKMTDAEKTAFFTKHIEAIKAKEAKEEAERKKAERSQGFETGDYSANSIFAKNQSNGFQDFETSSKSSFYFANENTVSKGQSQFQQTWGNRSLVDNWRFSAKSNSIEDTKNEALGLQNVQDPRRFEPEFYIEKIPTNPEEIAELKMARDTASLGLGRMYEEYFSDTTLATKTLYDLVDNKPEEEVKLQALYHIFSMNYEKNPSAGERAKQMILNEFPYTSYAEYVRNPKSNTFLASAPDVVKLYEQAFQLYKDEKFEESQAIVNQAIETYPNDALVPKFALLNAHNAGKLAGKEIMILQLNQIALNYPKTMEGEKAKEMLRYLKSDLDTPSDNAEKPTKENPKQASPQEETRPMPAKPTKGKESENDEEEGGFEE